MGSKNLFAGMCAVGLMLAIPTPVSSQPSHYSYDGWPYHYRPHYYDPGWSRGFNAAEQLLQCLFSQPFVSCG